MTEPVSAAAPPGLPYQQIHRGVPRATAGWWRPVLGTTALVAAMLLVVPLMWQVPFAVGYLVTGQPVFDSMDRLLDLTDPTPAGLAYLNLVLATAIPVTWLINRSVHGLRPRWLASVTPGLRWRWLLTCLGLSVLALFATLVVSVLVPASGAEGTEMGGQLNDFTTTTRDFLLVVLLLTPLQAAGEEYVFRGYLTQAFGGLFARPWVAVGGPALLFALAHGGQSAPVFFDRFAFGLVAGVLVIRTGGLEAGLAMHVLNNWLAFSLALAFGDMGSALSPSGGSWWSIPVTLTQALVYLGLVLLVARHQGLRTTTERAVLVAPVGRV